jgi:phosphoribosylanthranilate isomerase
LPPIYYFCPHTGTEVTRITEAMLLKTVVKISSVNNLSNARYCASMGVAMMGFLLDHGNAHYVDTEQFKSITQWIKGVALIGELSTTDPAIIHHTLDHYTLDYLQLSHPIALPSIARLDIPVLLKLSLHGNEVLASLQTLMDTYAPYVKYFLLEAAYPHETTIASLQPAINCLANSFPILQGCHVSAATLPHLLSTQLQGIALQGGTATKTGYEEFAPLTDVLEYLAIERR